MARQSYRQDNDPVVAAIERVLKIERDGVAALRHGQDEAHRMLAQARGRAAHIGQRVDACISRLHAAYLQKVERDIQACGETTDHR